MKKYSVKYMNISYLLFFQISPGTSVDVNDCSITSPKSYEEMCIRFQDPTKEEENNHLLGPEIYGKQISGLINSH